MSIARRLASTLAASAVIGGTVVGVTAMSTSTAYAATPCVHYTYSLGGVSTCIKYIQELANVQVTNAKERRIGGMPAKALVVDGAYGALTKAAIVDLQAHDFLITADGIVGPQTWRNLCTPQGVGGGSVASLKTWRTEDGLEAPGVAAGCGTLFPGY